MVRCTTASRGSILAASATLGEAVWDLPTCVLAQLASPQLANVAASILKTNITRSADVNAEEVPVIGREVALW
jgi:hypothetical protein